MKFSGKPKLTQALEADPSTYPAVIAFCESAISRMSAGLPKSDEITYSYDLWMCLTPEQRAGISVIVLMIIEDVLMSSTAKSSRE